MRLPRWRARGEREGGGVWEPGDGDQVAPFDEANGWEPGEMERHAPTPRFCVVITIFWKARAVETREEFSHLVELGKGGRDGLWPLDPEPVARPTGACPLDTPEPTVGISGLHDYES